MASGSIQVLSRAVINYSGTNYSLYKNGIVCSFYMLIPAGTVDQSYIVSNFSSKCIPITDVVLSAFCMNGGDLTKGICGLIYRGSRNIQVRTSATTTGANGVGIYGTWLAQVWN